MESAASTLTRYVVRSTVISVEERFHEFWISGHGSDATFCQVTRGYFALFEGSFEAIHLGFEPPELRVGDRVKITFEKELTS